MYTHTILSKDNGKVVRQQGNISSCKGFYRFPVRILETA